MSKQPAWEKGTVGESAIARRWILPARSQAPAKAESRGRHRFGVRAQRSPGGACLDSRRLKRCGKVVLGDGKLGGQGNSPGAFRHGSLRRVGRRVENQRGQESVPGVTAAAPEAGVAVAGLRIGIGSLRLPMSLMVAVTRRTGRSSGLALDVMRADKRLVGSHQNAAGIKNKERDENERDGPGCSRVPARPADLMRCSEHHAPHDLLNASLSLGLAAVNHPATVPRGQQVWSG